MLEGASQREDPAPMVIWKSVLGGDVPSKPTEWVENRVIDAPRNIGLMIACMAAFLGLILPVVFIPLLHLLGFQRDYWAMFPIFPFVYGIPFAVLFAYLSWRVICRRTESWVGIRPDGVAVRNKKGRVKWIPIDSINQVHPLYYSQRGETFVAYDAKAFGGGRSLIVNKDVAARISRQLDNAGYTLSGLGVVGKIEERPGPETTEGQEPEFVEKESRSSLSDQVLQHGSLLTIGLVMLGGGIYMTAIVLMHLLAGGAFEVCGVSFAIGLLLVSIPLTRISFIELRAVRKKLHQMKDGAD